VPPLTAPKVISSPYHPLHGFRLKLNRAQAHAETLNSEIDAWFKCHPYEVFGEYEPEPTPSYVFKVRFLEPVPSEWGIILGDFAHNARSALDHLAYQVVLFGTVGQHVDDTQFPIVMCPFAWEGRLKFLAGATDRHIGIIESLQPYHRRDFEGWRWFWSAIDDPLAILNRLAIVDKHIVLNATPASVLSIGWDIEIVRDVAYIGQESANTGILMDGGDLVRVAIAPSGPNPELKLNRSERVEIRVQYRVDMGPDTYTVRTVQLKESVDAILTRLREIFQVFVSEFK
jgi:hypothetical protein